MNSRSSSLEHLTEVRHVMPRCLHRRFDRDIKLGQNDPLFLLPMSASSFLHSHFIFHKNKPDLSSYNILFVFFKTVT
jgi:hypothetical protein